MDTPIYGPTLLIYVIRPEKHLLPVIVMLYPYNTSYPKQTSLWGLQYRSMKNMSCRNLENVLRTFQMPEIREWRYMDHTKM